MPPFESICNRKIPGERARGTVYKHVDVRRPTLPGSAVLKVETGSAITAGHRERVEDRGRHNPASKYERTTSHGSPERWTLGRLGLAVPAVFPRHCGRCDALGIGRVRVRGDSPLGNTQ